MAIIEGEYGLDEEVYQAFEDDYLNSNLTVYELQKKYDFSAKQAVKYKKEVFARTGYKRKGGHPNPQYIGYVKSLGKWRVFKQVDGKFNVFGYYKDKITAINIRDRLIDCNWDKSQLEMIKAEVLMV